jgi:diacylglycerol kinase (ATP)
MASKGYFAARIEAFRHAGRGLREMLRSETHARIHAVATLTVIIAGLGFEIERGEWLALVLTIGAVWSLEAMNTAVEALGDLVSPGPNEHVRRAKDAAAGGVLIAALVALVVAALVFGPRLASLAR